MTNRRAKNRLAGRYQTGLFESIGSQRASHDDLARLNLIILKHEIAS